MPLTGNRLQLLKYLKGIEDLEGLSLWDIARETGLKNAQTVSHHLKQLEKFGYLRRDISDPSKFEILKDPVEDVVYIQLFGFAQCGNEADFFSEGNLKEKVAISTRMFGIPRPQDSFLVRARGDSMSPEIDNNDLVLLERQNDAEDGNIALVIDNGDPKIKKIFKKGRKEYLLTSINKKHPDKIVRSGRSFRVLGLAKAVMRGL